MTFYLEGLAIIVILGVTAQWLAWRFNLPAIVLLLFFGFIAGPITRFLSPADLFGNLLSPIISFSVAIILFEGGLNLRLEELKTIRRVVFSLITVGAVITLFIIAASAHFIFNLDPAIAMLLGAILVVSGPTVIVPLLRHVRPLGRVASILRWEGIIIDPIGAMLAVLVFEAIMSGELQRGFVVASMGFAKTILIGGIIGYLGGKTLIVLLKKYWVPDFLSNPLSLTIVISVYALTNLFQAEAGLLAVTLMGITVANQKDVAVKQIIEFKESLRVLLIANLFIILAATLKIEDVHILNLRSLAFIALIIFIVRPAAVFLSTLKSDLSMKERFFIAAVAPRGIVAAAIASIFSMRLVEAGRFDAELMAPLTFLVIISTVIFYSVISAPLARKLGLAKPHPQGTLIVGAHPLARAVANALQKENFRVLLVDTNWINIAAARDEGLPSYYGSVISESAMEDLDLGGIGRILAMTSNDEVNSLAVLHFTKEFGRAEAYQLPHKGADVSEHLRGRMLFHQDANYAYLSERIAAGAVVKAFHLSPEFDYENFRASHTGIIPMFLISEGGELIVWTTDKKLSPQAEQMIISLIDQPAVQRTASA